MQNEKTIPAIIVSGKFTDLDNFRTLQAYFINGFKDNGVEVEVKFTIHSTPDKPITENGKTHEYLKFHANEYGFDLQEIV